MINEVVLPIAPVPPISFFVACLRCQKIWVDPYEHYVKQTIRNRYHVMNANAVLALTIDVKGQGGVKVATSEVKIENSKGWVRNHLRTLEAAYRSAPFFEHYFPLIEAEFRKSYATLGHLFEALFPLWLRLLKIEIGWSYSDGFFERAAAYDLRQKIKDADSFHPDLTSPSYVQVFSDRFGFKPNLSVIDLLMNVGPAAGGLLV